MDENGHETDAELQTKDSSTDDAGELAKATSMTLVEVVPGAAVVFGNIPEGLELVDFGLIPGFDRERLSTVLGSIGNAGTVAGNVANAISSAQGLYRVNDATLALLKSGGKLAAKDGAYLGTVLTNGSLAQARFIPYGVTAAAAAAAIGPAIAMIALQMQLSEISGLVRTNIALTTQTLKMIRHEQWSELTGLVKSIDRAIKQASEIEGVTKSLWNNVAGNEAALDKQLDLYKRNVDSHIKQLGQLSGTPRRQYLKTNAEAILFDANALLYSLKAHTGYQAIRAAWARVEGADNEKEAQLVDVITRDARAEFDAALHESAELVELLRRELRIIAELPGRATMPLTKKRRDAKTSRLTCNQLLEAIEPLANTLHPAAAELTAPDLVCAPEDLDVEPYLHVLRWFLEDGEELRGIAFPYQPGKHNLVGALPPVLGKRVDATWSALAPGKWAAVVNTAASSTFVAVTDSRIITAAPRALLHRGELGESFLLGEVEFVRPPQKQSESIRPTVDVITEHQDLRWIFPSAADAGSIDKLVVLLNEGATTTRADRMAIADLRVQESESGADQTDADGP
ncbi:hypothetical protein [Cryobacterium fucosi]|uniref:Uncharacterized protein n=1 Tax=Cryobacterium fucosi TaxID=1259157 RepID=A0A4R9B9V0_9MICO|nr:hypothetical protein [Cryobacterium fucosi]TFD79238.1 hypothetical protein E3T48_06655 [Cryobacterium fucosi]